MDLSGNLPAFTKFINRKESILIIEPSQIKIKGALGLHFVDQIKKITI
jgi:hypothetical protein